MSRNRITVALEKRVFVARGWRAVDLMREAGLKPIYSGTVGGWMADRHRLADLLAYLDSRRIPVTIIDPDQPGLFDGAEGGGAA